MRNKIYPDHPATSNTCAHRPSQCDTSSWWVTPVERDHLGRFIETQEIESFADRVAKRTAELKAHPAPPSSRAAISSKREIKRRQSAMRFESQTVSVREVAERDMRTEGVRILEELFGESD
jgi:hypothetical protein